MMNPYEVWAGTIPPHDHGGAITYAEGEIIVNLDWRGANNLLTVWQHDRDGMPYAYLWPARLHEQNVVFDGEKLVAYSTRTM